MINILICGGSGFIGGRLSTYLSSFLDNKVFSLSRKKISYESKNINYLYLQNFDFINLNELFKGVDVVIHLACMSSRDCQKNPKNSIITNTKITKNIVNACINNGVKKLIYISSIHVYGKNLKGLVNENTEASPLHPYAISHKKSEDIIFDVKTNSLKTTIFRLSNAYGYPTDINANCWDLIINNVCKQIIEKHSIVLKTDGAQKRNFLQMRDVCRIIHSTIKKNNKVFEDQIFNLGGKWTGSILEVAEFISKTISNKLNINKIDIKVNRKKEQFTDFKYDISKIEKLDFKTSCNEMLEMDNLIDYCKNNFKYKQ